MQSSPPSCHFIHLRSKYSPQHPILRHNCSSHSVRDQVSLQYKTAGNIIILYILIFKFLKTKDSESNDKHLQYLFSYFLCQCNFHLFLFPNICTLTHFILFNARMQWSSQTTVFNMYHVASQGNEGQRY